MPCDTCFLGHVARRYRWQQSFDPMTSLNLTFDAGQVKVRFAVPCRPQIKTLFEDDNALQTALPVVFLSQAQHEFYEYHATEKI